MPLGKLLNTSEEGFVSVWVVRMHVANISTKKEPGGDDNLR